MRVLIVLLSFAIVGFGLFMVNFDSFVLKSLESNPEKLVRIIEKYQETKKIELEKQKIRALAKKPLFVNTDNSPSMGDSNSKYKFVIFTDYQCFYCKNFEEILQEILEKHGHEMQIFYKNLPLVFHKEAEPAARAAWAAAQQGKFFEYSKKLFENQKALGYELYLSIAKELGLNIQKFKLDFLSDKAKESIQNDIQEAKKLGFNGTPGILVNGIPVKGAYPPEYFDMVIEIIDENN